MSRSRPAYGRAPARPRLRRAGLVLTALAAFAAVPASAGAASADQVQLTNVFAMPIATTDPQCTPEPPNRVVYGTAQPFDSAGVTNPDSPMSGVDQGAGNPSESGKPGYRAPNVRSTSSLTPALGAGESNDLCFGFTLTPNMESGNVRPDTINGNSKSGHSQETPPLPDVAGTHVIDGSGNNDDMKKVVVTMPAGMAGEPDAIPTCSDQQFGAGLYTPVSCPDEAIVGSLFVRLQAKVTWTDSGDTYSLTSRVLAGGGRVRVGDGLVDGGFLYNLPHGPNELARLGAVIQPVPNLAPTKFTISMRLAPDGSGRLQTVVDPAPREAFYLSEDPDLSAVYPDGTLKPGAVPSPIYVESIGIRAWGSNRLATSPKPFLQFGTNCTDQVSAHADLTTYQGAQSSMDSNSFTMTGCDSLPFLPDVKFTTSSKSPATTTGLDVKVSLGQSTSGPRTALLRDASVTMPEGLEIGAQVASGASGLPLCSAAAFAKDSLAANTCPAGSKAGDVTIVTPLLDTNFVGAVYLGEQPAVGELPPLYLEAAPEGATGADAPRIKLVGTVKVDENGRLTTTFKDAPQLRFSELRLSFPAGDHALFVTPRTCSPVSGKSTFTSWAGQTVALDSSIQMTENCDLPAFNPSLGMVPSSNVVGARAPVAVGIAREDRSPWLKDVKVDLPSGFLSDLTVVTECPVATAAAGGCPDSSRIGTVTTQAGVGGAPLSLTGKMYLVSPSNGSVADASIVVHALIGDLDLGNVVVPARIDLRPTDAGLTLTTSAPLRFKGLALNLRTIIVNLDRDNFPLNPTGCGPLTAVASITGDNGVVATPTSTVSYVGCGALPFEPSFEAKLSGDTRPKGHPQVDVTMTPRPGDSNLKGARVVLPAGISTDPKNLQNFCRQADFYAGTCSEAARVGNVSASVAITNDVISGGVYLVKVDGFVLPGLGMSFTGRYPQRVLSTVKIDKSLRVITEFAAIPDLPLRRLQMTIGGGSAGPIQISPDACTADTAWEATFTGQGGQSKQVNLPVPCEGAAVPKASTKWSRKTGLKLTLTAPDGRTFKSTKLTLPKGFKLKSGKARTKYAKIKLSGGKGKLKRSSRSLSATAKGAGPKKVTFQIRTSGYKLPKSYKNKLKKGKKLKLKYRTVDSDGKAVSKTLTVKVK